MGEDTSKTFPGMPFDTFDGCVASVGDDPSIDDPEAFCNWLDEEGKEALSDPQAEDILTGLEVEFVSAVDTPAQDSEWVMAKNAEDPEGETHTWRSEVPLLVAKESDEDADEPDNPVQKDGDRQIAYAPVLIPGEADKQGDVIPSPEIEKAAHRYLTEYRKVDSDHDLRDGKGEPVESWTCKTDLQFDKPDGETSRTYPKGTWLMGIRFDDETWSRVKDGELSGLSIYGGASPIDVESLLGKQAGGDDVDRKAVAMSTEGDAAEEGETMQEDEDQEKDADVPDDTGDGVDDPVESTEKQDASADTVNTMLAEFRNFVSESGSVEASMKEFVSWILNTDRIDESEITGLDVFLNGAEAGDEGPPEPDDESGGDDGGGGDDSEQPEMSLSDEEKAEDTADGEDESAKKSTDDDMPEWAQDLRDTVEDLQKKVDDAPSGDRMSVDESDRMATIKSLFDVEDDEDAETIRKAVVEQVENGEDAGSIDFDGITDDEGADAEASSSSGNTAAANSRMISDD